MPVSQNKTIVPLHSIQCTGIEFHKLQNSIKYIQLYCLNLNAEHTEITVPFGVGRPDKGGFVYNTLQLFREPNQIQTTQCLTHTNCVDQWNSGVSGIKDTISSLCSWRIWGTHQMWGWHPEAHKHLWAKKANAHTTHLLSNMNQPQVICSYNKPLYNKSHTNFLLKYLMKHWWNNFILIEPNSIPLRPWNWTKINQIYVYRSSNPGIMSSIKDLA